MTFYECNLFLIYVKFPIPKTFVIAVHFTDLLFHAHVLGDDNDETFAATFFAPEHHKKAKADRQPTVIQRTISRRMVTKSLSRDWDDSYSNWRAPRRMPLVLRPIRGLLCISDGRRPILQSVSSHVEARTLYPKIYTKMWKVKH